MSSEAPFLVVDLAEELGCADESEIPFGELTGADVEATSIRLIRWSDHANIRWQTRLGDVITRPAVGWGTVFATTSDGVLHAVETSNGSERWSSPLGAKATAPVLFDEIVFASGGDRLHALDAEDGSEVWSATLGANTRFSASTINDGVLYVGGSDGKVYAVHPANGDPYWYTTIGGPIETVPAVSGDQVYARSIDGNVYALDTATGEVRWRHSVGWTFEATAPVVADGIVVAGGPGGTVTALNASTGAMRWQLRTPGVIASTPVATGDTVYVPTAGSSRRAGSICAIDAASGAVRWRSDLDSYLASPLGTTERTVYVGDAEGCVRAFDRLTGAEVWSYPRQRGFAASAPIMLGGTLYLGYAAAGWSPSVGSAVPRGHLKRG